MPSGPPEFILPFIPVTGMKCSYGKISSPLTDSLGEHPFFSALVSPRSDDRKYVCGSQASLLRSREPSQPALLYGHIENFTKDLEVRRDLGHRANRAHLRRPSVRRSVSQPFVKSVSQSDSHSVSQPVSHLVSRSVSQSIRRLDSHSTSNSVSREEGGGGGKGTPYNGRSGAVPPERDTFFWFQVYVRV